MKKGISIDIGSDLIKIISYKKSKNSLVVKKAVSLKLPDCEMRDGMIVDVDIMAETIKAAMIKNKIKGKIVNFVISSNRVITREVNYPDLPDNKLEMMINMNSAEHFPVNLQNYTINYAVLEYFTEDNKKMIRTNTVVVPNEIAVSYVELAEKLKLKIGNITYSENAMMNYSLLVNGREPYMIIDIASDRTSVAVVRKGKVALNKTLGSGIREIINIVKEKYEVDYDAALEIIGENEFIVENTSLQDTFTGKVLRNINLVVSGVARLLDYYGSKYDEPVSNIYISGAGVCIRGLEEYMSKYFGIDTKNLENIKCIKSSDIEYSSKKNIYANAVGAVYSDVNLLPDSFLNNKRKSRNVLRFVGITLLIVSIAGALIYYPLVENARLEEEISSLEFEKQLYESVDDLIVERDNLKLREEFLLDLDATFSNDYKSLEILKKLEEITPKDIYYSHVEIDADGVSISCKSNSKNSIANYLKDIKEIKLNDRLVFKEVFIPSIIETLGINDEEKDRLEFNVNCKFFEKVFEDEAKEVNDEK